MDKRAFYKNEFKLTKNSEFDSKQNFLKTITNTVYGVTASQYFNISNLCFANNVTGRARNGVWILSKAFNLKQTITDGGIYEVNKVLTPWICNKKPSLHTLYKIHDTPGNSYILEKYFRPLGFKDNKDLKRTIKPNWNLIFNKLSKRPFEKWRNLLIKIVDKLCNDHLINFCKYYNIEDCLKYFVENKPSNIFKRAATMGRGHYYLELIDNKEVFKIRGTQKPNDEIKMTSPIYEILKNTLCLSSFINGERHKV